ncbi:MAG TPA: hypothetical protein VMT03_14565 [Polyangia bacterium]|nr:hypothetical protein [Polyangia bacterium]
MAYSSAARFGVLASAFSALALFAASCGDNWPAQTNAMGGEGGQQTGGTGGGASDGGMDADAGGTGGSPDAAVDGAAGMGGDAGTGGMGGAGGLGGGPDAGTGGQAGGSTGTGGVGGGPGGVGGSTGGAGGSTGGLGGATGGAGGLAGSGGTGGVAGMGGAGGCQSASDCTSGQVCDGATNSCVPCPSDSACRSGYGPQHVCVGGACIQGDCQTYMDCSNQQICVNNFCTNCTGDPDCQSTYGPDHLCISGGCVAGVCRSANDCNKITPGQICTPGFQCTDCTFDDDCISGYGANHLCVSGRCVAGNCRQTNDCKSGGRICNTSTLMCVPCTDDANCMANYTGQQLCLNGSCTPGNCRTTGDCSGGQVCDLTTHMCGSCPNDAACGSGQLCVNGLCIAGECRVSTDCAGSEAGEVCDASNYKCNPCIGDSDCVTAYGTNHLCITSGSSKVCVSGTCHTTIPDCGGGEICDGTTHTCGQCSNDTACVNAYGPQHLCINNVCVAGQCRASKDCPGGALCDTISHTCHACGSDAACQADPSYGVTDVCISGACTAGDCHTSSLECPTGQLCGVSHTDTCGACSSDGQCTADTTAYGPGYICYQGLCQPGDCHGTSADCTGAVTGQVCGAVTANDCGLCSSDSQCQSDPFYGSSRICQTASGPTSGTCVSAACSTSGACSANPGDFCCNNICTAGNCCVDADCASFGSPYRCVNNSCTGCSAATGNTYFVDPINGSDGSATGSGMAGGIATASCSFKTVTHALAVVSGIGATGTKIVIVGQAGQTVALDMTETLPIVVPANVAISTKTGPIRVNLPAASDTAFGGFRLVGDQAVISPDPSAPITIDGNANSSGIGIGVAPGSGKTAAVSYVTVQNTGGNGIAVTSGTLNILQGVTVTNAGSSSRHHDGLNVSGGTVNITVSAGQATTSFNSNTEHGIYVTGAAVLNITGVPVTTPGANGQGTVIANSNAFDGLEIFEGAGVAAQSTITGLVAWGNTKQGVQLFGGEKVKVRRSVLLNNKLNGLFLTAADSSAASNDLTGINLGTAGDPGLNQLQASLGSNADLAGLCVSMAASQGALSLSAEGNTFSGPTDCTTSTSAIARSTTCANNVDIGIVPASGTTVTIDTATCN